MHGVVVLKTGDYVCPYNSSHCVRPLRFQIHLVKCRKQHKNTMAMFVCPFNAKHHVPEAEAKFHVAHCPDKALVDAHDHACKELRKLRTHGDTSTPGYLQSSHVFESFNREFNSEEKYEEQSEQFGDVALHRRKASVEYIRRGENHEERQIRPTSRATSRAGDKVRRNSARETDKEDAYTDFSQFVLDHIDDNANDETDAIETVEVGKKEYFSGESFKKSRDPFDFYYASTEDSSDDESDADSWWGHHDTSSVTSEVSERSTTQIIANVEKTLDDCVFVKQEERREIKPSDHVGVRASEPLPPPKGMGRAFALLQALNRSKLEGPGRNRVGGLA